jgi:hypothetical protein
MSLIQITADNGWVYLLGVTNSEVPQALGPVGRTFSSSDPDNFGVHYGALYPVTPSTAVLRLFFDNTKPAKNDLGYIQFCKLSSLGHAIPPSAVPALASRRFYCGDQTKGAYVEFMGPNDANARWKGEECEVPFYPLNARLMRQFNPAGDFYQSFCWHPMPNGSIRRGDNLNLPSQSRPATDARPSNCASLVFSISPFLITEAALAAHCQDDQVLVNEIKSAGEIENQSLFSVVSALLLVDDDSPAPTFKDVQAVGSCLVLTLSEDEEGAGGPVLVARIQAVPNNENQRRIVIWQLDRDMFASVQHDATMDTLRRIDTWFKERQIFPNSVQIPPQGRGWTGLRRPPEIVNWTQGPLLELSLLSVVCEWTKSREGNARIISRAAVATKLSWTYDPVAESLDLFGGQPVPVPQCDWQALAESLKLYAAALASPPTDAGYDESAFIIAGSPWFDSAKPFPGNNPA